MLPEWLPLAALCLACAAAAWLDLRHRRIPNWLCGLTALAGLGAALILNGPPALGSHALHSFLALLGGMVLFRLGVIGGGDAKLYAGAAAWFALDKGIALLLSVALSGLLLVIGWLVYRRIRRLPLRGKNSGAFDSLPYALAIGMGTIATATL